MPSVIPATQAGRLKRSRSRPAMIPTTPACQPSPATSSTARPASICASPSRRAASSTEASTPWRWRFTASSASAMSRASPGSSPSRRRTPRSACPSRPEALMRGPSAKPSAMAPGAPRTCATSSNAASPGRSRRAMTRRPWVTNARLSPVSGMTSHTVASATRSSSSSRSGSARSANQPERRSARTSATMPRKQTPAAQDPPRPDRSSLRLGLTVASTGGGGPSAVWWSNTTTSATPRIAASASCAEVPQSAQMTRLAPRPVSARRAGAFGPYPSRNRSGT